MAVSVYECASLAQLVYRYGWEKSEKNVVAQDAHVGFADDTHTVLTALGDWARQYIDFSKQTGFVGAIFAKSKTDVVVSFRGSVSKQKDWAGADVKMFLRKLPENHFLGGSELYTTARGLYPSATIVVVGHSLGGAIAQLVARYHGCPGVSFNAPGMATHAEKLPVQLPVPGGGGGAAVVNFREARDPVSAAIGGHIGVVYDLNLPQVKQNLAQKLVAKGMSHKMGPLVEYIGKQAWKDRSPFEPCAAWTEAGTVGLPV
jgi:hypothetical protein